MTSVRALFRDRSRGVLFLAMWIAGVFRWPRWPPTTEPNQGSVQVVTLAIRGHYNFMKSGLGRPFYTKLTLAA